jgi:muramoyltetrapeptide carboxypeptidase
VPSDGKIIELTGRDSCAYVRDMRVPAPLQAGSRVALIAPSGPLRGSLDLECAIDTTRSLGWEPVVGAHVLDHDGYLAGTDVDRVADLNQFANDHSIDAVWCIRGGYGAMRLLESIDVDAWRSHPKTLIGYSDITALHAIIGGRAQLVTYHGPTARETLTPLSRASLLAAVSGCGNPCGEAPDAIPLRGGRATGRLAGGNLALLSALSGTPYAPSLRGAIVVLEDVNEAVYRIDRMLTQLRLSGMLDGIHGLALGHFSDIPDDVANEERPLERVVNELAARCGVPCLFGIPVGHIREQWTIPFGATATLDADARTLVVEQNGR